MTLYEEAGGFDGLLALCRRWHELCLADPVAEHPFSRPSVHPRHNERLAAYLSEALGGPRLYTAGYGDETYMQRLHAGNGMFDEQYAELIKTCLRLFDQALNDVGISADAASRISAYFRTATAAMRAYDESVDLVPDDLPLNLA